MRVGETLSERTPESSLELAGDNSSEKGSSLSQSVRLAVRAYLEELDGQLGSDVYQMVLAEIEAPLLEEIMQYTRNNQTRASQMLGLNRGTLRKKLKQHGLLKDNGA
jgi:Fis family transcriptional regulator